MRRRTLDLRYKTGFIQILLSSANYFHVIIGMSRNFIETCQNPLKPTEEDIAFEINKVNLILIGRPMRSIFSFWKILGGVWNHMIGHRMVGWV